MWRNHVSTYRHDEKDVPLGERDINSIKITDLDNFLYDMYQNHSFAYTQGFLKFFYLLFGYAYDLELIDGDRYYRMFGDSKTRLSMPIKDQSDVEVEDDIETYTDDELAVIEKIFMSEDGNLLTAFYLGIYCGLRISECFAVRWSNVNWEKGTITINRQLHNTSGQITLSKVKTMTAIREVIMPSFLHDYLDSFYQQQRKEQSKAGQHYKATEKVYDEVLKEWIVGGDFINRRSNGELLTVNSMKYWSKKIKAETGIEFKFHNLRHTYATNCAFNNVNMLLLKQMLGHKKTDTTEAYYLKIDVDKYKNKSMKLLDSLYDFHGRTPEDKPPVDYIETIDSKGRKTKYMK
jgi:integrase